MEPGSLGACVRRGTCLDALVGEIAGFGGRAVVLVGDVTDEGCAKALVDTAVGTFGGLDIGFNDAGALGEMAATSELTRQAWTATLEINLTVAFLGAKHQISAMQARGEAVRSSSLLRSS